jgi:hypothetical protein
MTTEMLRYNTGKPQLSYFPSSFWRALLEVTHDDFNVGLIEDIAKVSAFGAKKYSKDNWRTSGSWCRCADSGLRHLLAYMDGDSHDAESGMPHLAHFGWNLMALIEFRAAESGTDDRYKRPDTQKVVEFDEERPVLLLMMDLLSRWLECENEEYLDYCLILLNNMYGEEAKDDDDTSEE